VIDEICSEQRQKKTATDRQLWALHTQYTDTASAGGTHSTNQKKNQHRFLTPVSRIDNISCHKMLSERYNYDNFCTAHILKSGMRNEFAVTPCLRKSPTFDLLQSWHTRSDYDIFWQKCYCESKESDDALLSRLTHLVLLHYLAYNTVQLLKRSQLRLSWTMPPTAPSWTHWLHDLQSHTAAWVWVVSQKHWTSQAAGWIQAMHECSIWAKMRLLCFPVLPGSVEAQVIWGGIVKRVLIAYFISNVSAKNIKIRSRASKL